MLNRRELLVGSAGLGYVATAAGAVEKPILSAYYQRAHMYTIVPRHVREDLKWMAGIGTNVVCVAMLEQDLFAAIDNVNLISEEAAKAGLKVFAIPSRWGGLVAGSPKVPSLFSVTHPETWILKKDGKPHYWPSNSGVISSVHHPATLEFFCNTVDELFKTFPAVAGIIWDEPKGFTSDYSKLAVEKLGPDAPESAHWQAAADFYGKVTLHLKQAHPGKLATMFMMGTDQPGIAEIACQIQGLDYFGMDGRPWSNKEDVRWAGTVKENNESGRGKVLVDKGPRYIELAKKAGKKSVLLVENHALRNDMIPVMDACLPQVLALSPDQLIYYYYPRSVEDPERSMAVIAKHLGRWRK
jgi:hypothetical protein